MVMSGQCQMSTGQWHQTPFINLFSVCRFPFSLLLPSAYQSHCTLNNSKQNTDRKPKCTDVDSNRRLS